MAAVTPIALLTHQPGYKLLCRLDLIYAYKSLWRSRRDGLAALARFISVFQKMSGERMSKGWQVAGVVGFCLSSLFLESAKIVTADREGC